MALLCAWCAEALTAQTPCPEVQVIATHLLGPSKIIQTPLGNYLVAEVGMYGVVSSRGTVWRANRDGSEQILLSGQNDPHAVVLDTIAGKM
ncbi:MAG: hypothetical protein KJ072_26730 [Verrucomicrobia bacterium]|nr:hypothetical protein [Verrucomicrobiota bacterium]